MCCSFARSSLIAIFLTVGCQGNYDGTQGRADPSSDPGASGTGGGTGDGRASGPGATAGSGPGATAGSGPGANDGGANSGGANSGSGAGSSCNTGALPAAVQAILGSHCQTCHRNPPLPTVSGSLMTSDDFGRPAKSNPSLTMAEATLMRVTSTSSLLRMPPAPAAPLTSAEIQTLQTWISAGHLPATCDPGASSPDGGPAVSPPDAGPDPFAAPAKCTSGTMWTGGTRESPLMQPGEACVACHTRGEAPRLSFGGTVYPSAHEPSQCNGAAAAGAQVVVVDVNGVSATANVNAAGNFFASARTILTPPLKAKVVFMGRERVMITAVPSGDCNACHTQKGTTTITTAGALPAPGRILLP